MEKYIWKRNQFGFVIVCFIIISALHSRSAYAEVTEWNQVNSADWMEYVDDEKQISEITIPGSHDSATQYIPFSYFAQCQEDSIAIQLENGVRFLDIRLKSKEKEDKIELELSHGFLSCKVSSSIFSEKLTFKSVIEECYNFLDSHPEEIIIMAIKHEHGKQTEKEVQKAIYEIIEDKKETYWYLKNDNPNVEKVRGKIVLARRYEDENGFGDETGGLNFQWRDQNGTDIKESSYEENEIKEGIPLLVQDRYEYEEEDKWEVVKHGLEQSESSEEFDDGFFLNYLSTKGSNVFGHPKKYADALNQKFLNYDLKKDCDYGIVIMDFITEELARKVYESNKFVSN